MSNAKKFLIIVFTVMLVLSIQFNMSKNNFFPSIKFNYANAEKPKATGHLLWDNIDQVWRCVGSPINCAF